MEPAAESPTARPLCAPGCPSTGRVFSTPAVTHARECPRCGGTIWCFPNEHGPDAEVRIPAADLVAARAGRCEALERTMLEALSAGWWVEPRDWARHLETIHPDLAAWHHCFRDTPGLREGLTALIEERGSGAPPPPALDFAVETTALPPGAQRALHGLGNLGARSEDALILSVRGPTAAEAGLLCRWRRDAAPEVLRRDARHTPLGGELWAEETPTAVSLLRVPARRPVEVLRRDDARLLLTGHPTEDGHRILRWTPRDASTGPVRTEYRTLEGRPCAPPPTAAPAPKHPDDDGFNQRIVARGFAWAGQGQVRFSPPGGAPGWSMAGGFEWTGSDRLFVLRSLEHTAPQSVHVVDAVSGERSGPLTLPQRPMRITAVAMDDAVLVVADARCARVSPGDAAPRWVTLPFACEVALGEHAGPFVVLVSHDDRERFLVLEAGPGALRIRGEVRGATPVRTGGFGPVFLSDDRWRALAWGPE
jgi:hypothetical protein